MSFALNVSPMSHLFKNMTSTRDQHMKFSAFKGAQWKAFEDRIPSDSLTIKKSSRNFGSNDEKWRIQRLNTDASAIVRLDNRDRDVYGTCPEQDTFLGVLCNECSDIIKPSSLPKHIRNRHCQHRPSSTNRSNFPASSSNDTFNTHEAGKDIGDRYSSAFYASTGSSAHYTSTLTNSSSKLKISMAPITSKNVNQSPPKPKNRSIVYTKPKPKNSGKRGPTEQESAPKSLESSLQKVSLAHSDAKSLHSMVDPFNVQKVVKPMVVLSKTHSLIERKPSNVGRRKTLSALKGMNWSAFAKINGSVKNPATGTIEVKSLAMANINKGTQKLDIMRLDFGDRGVFGMSPETEELLAVVCKGCSAVLKPQGLLIHQENRGCLHHTITSQHGTCNESIGSITLCPNIDVILTSTTAFNHSSSDKQDRLTSLLQQDQSHQI